MKIYFDRCSLQRPLDNRSQFRIAIEAEAILGMYEERLYLGIGRWNLPLDKKPKNLVRLAPKKKYKIYRFWYDVYYREMGRNRKYVNLDKKMLIDEFEPNSDCLYVENDNAIVGTSRIITNDMFLGYYYNFYALDLFGQDSYCVVTKYINYLTNLGNMELN